MCSVVPLSCLGFLYINRLQSVMTKRSPLLPPAVGNMTQQPVFSGSEVILRRSPFCCACSSNTIKGMERLFYNVSSFWQIL